jgi:hypothetical protein
VTVLTALGLVAALVVQPPVVYGDDGYAHVETMEQTIRRLWPDDSEDKAVQVAWCESRFDPGATNGSHRGLFQMNWRLHWKRAFPFGADGLYDPVVNIQAALSLFIDVGWSAWSCA